MSNGTLSIFFYMHYVVTSRPRFYQVGHPYYYTIFEHLT